jgi:TonB family protein
LLQRQSVFARRTSSVKSHSFTLLALLVLGVAAFANPTIAFAQAPPGWPASRAYIKVMKAKINSLWQGYAQASPQSVTPGTVTVSFRLNADGTAQDIRVRSNTSNQFLADVCVRAIRNAKLPPLPAAVIREQGHAWADVRDMEFTAPESWRH